MSIKLLPETWLLTCDFCPSSVVQAHKSLPQNWMKMLIERQVEYYPPETLHACPICAAEVGETLKSINKRKK